MIDVSQERVLVNIIVSEEITSKVFRHDAIEIVAGDNLPDMAAATLVTNHEAERVGVTHNVRAVIKAGVRAGAEDTGDTRFVGKQGMACGKSVGIDKDFRLRKHRFEHRLYNQAVSIISTAGAVEKNPIGITDRGQSVNGVTDDCRDGVAGGDIRIETVRDNTRDNGTAVSQQPFTLSSTAVNNKYHIFFAKIAFFFF